VSQFPEATNFPSGETATALALLRPFVRKLFSLPDATSQSLIDSLPLEMSVFPSGVKAIQMTEAECGSTICSFGSPSKQAYIDRKTKIHARKNAVTSHRMGLTNSRERQG
jgi:hypothetical protein